MHPSHSGPSSTKPNTVRAAQVMIWLQFAAILALYGVGLNFLLAATMAASSAETMFEVLNGGGAERWILTLTAIGVTVSLPVIAIALGRGKEGSIRAAWYALAFVPFCMYVWVAARAYLATFPDGPEFFIGAGAMFALCAALPTAILLCLASRSARAWFSPAEPQEAPIPNQTKNPELVGAAATH